MNSKKVKEIIKFSFYKDIQNKWFIIFNVITLLSLLIMMNFNHISSFFNLGTDNDIFIVEVIDSENISYESFVQELSKSSQFVYSKVNENTYTAETIPKNLAVIEILPDEEEMLKFTITSKEGINGTIYEKLKSALKECRNKLFAEKYDIEPTELSILQSDLNINRVMLAVDAEDSTTKDLIKLISSALTYFVAILIFSKLSNEIAQEKQSKSSEYILTTVSAKEYLFAKIFSNVAIVLIQGIFLLAYYYIASLLSRIFTISATDLSLSASLVSNSINTEIVTYIIALIVYNVLNIVLLCIIQAALAAKTASISEAGNTMTLLTTIVIICYIVANTVIDPYTKVNMFLAIISCLPILSEFFIPALLVIGQCNIWQIVLSLVLLVASIPLAFNLSARIFKNGILDYTKVKIKHKKEVDKEQIFLLKRSMRELGFVVGLAILIYIGIQTILSLIAPFAIKTLFANILNETEINLIIQIVLQVFSLGLASIFVLAYCNKPNVNSQAVKVLPQTKVKLIFIAVFLIFALQAFLTMVLYPPLGLNYDIIDMFEISAESSLLTKIIAILTIAVTPAIFEELFFRKALIDFTSRYSKKFALVFSALLFGLIHMNLSQGLFAFILGIIMGTIYLYTNDIKLTMIVHFINNGVATLAMILPELLVALFMFILLAFMMAGLVFLIQSLVKKSSRQKILSLFNTKISPTSIDRYKYIFTDYTFDISIILVIIMSILTENLLR